MRTATRGPVARNDAKLETRAAELDVAPSGAYAGVYTVASGSEGFTWHIVDTRPWPWLCDCYGSGSLCSHKRAVRRYLGQRQRMPRAGAT